MLSINLAFKKKLALWKWNCTFVQCLFIFAIVIYLNAVFSNESNRSGDRWLCHKHLASASPPNINNQLMLYIISKSKIVSSIQQVVNFQPLHRSWCEMMNKNMVLGQFSATHSTNNVWMWRIISSELCAHSNRWSDVGRPRERKSLSLNIIKNMNVECRTYINAKWRYQMCFLLSQFVSTRWQMNGSDCGIYWFRRKNRKEQD